MLVTPFALFVGKPKGGAVDGDGFPQRWRLKEAAN
jgi:hypothetical protein